MDQRSLPFLLTGNDEIVLWRGDTFWDKEPETLLWIQNFSELHLSKSVFIDVGANIGIYSLYAASLHPELKILAIEPVLANYQNLESNISCNKFSQISPFHLALAEKERSVTLNISDSRVGSSGAQIKDMYMNSESTSTDGEIIKCWAGDQLVANLAEYESIFLKIDVDGVDSLILQGFSATLSSGKIKKIMIEGSYSNRVEITKYLAKFGLIEDRTYELIPNHSSIRRAVSKNTEINLFFNLT
jgi:FkbM family methyltransferase